MIALFFMVAGVVALSMVVRRHERRMETDQTTACGIHQIGGADASSAPGRCRD
jgi:hypothetical protein